MSLLPSNSSIEAARQLVPAVSLSPQGSAHPNNTRLEIREEAGLTAEVLELLQDAG
jgi:hypothetical protein